MDHLLLVYPGDPRLWQSLVQYLAAYPLWWSPYYHSPVRWPTTYSLWWIIHCQSALVSPASDSSSSVTNSRLAELLDSARDIILYLMVKIVLTQDTSNILFCTAQDLNFYYRQNWRYFVPSIICAEIQMYSSMRISTKYVSIISASVHTRTLFATRILV